MFTFPKFHKFHPRQNSSGLVPPPDSLGQKPQVWSDRDIAQINKPIWSAEPVKPEPAPPTREEKLALARQEAIDCLSDPDADNSNLVSILKIKHQISPEDARQAVREAQPEIERGAKEDV
jgi:hypothetical protein